MRDCTRARFAMKRNNFCVSMCEIQQVTGQQGREA
jgi:hypothetical protein